LLRDHAELEQVFRQLLAACRANARDDAAHAWAELDRRLTAHLALEEAVIFPRLTKVAPIEVAALGREHSAIRHALDELGVEVDLHVLRLTGARAFIKLLRDHARREDGLMYRWAEASLPASAQVTVLSALHK
jgi:hemerythrin superfamily protein